MRLASVAYTVERAWDSVVDATPVLIHTKATLAMNGKWLELFKEIAPKVTRIAILRDLP
jgi:hypothetical protein